MTAFEEVEKTQLVYRELLQAMARPAEFRDLPVSEIWQSSIFAIVETLFDHEVSFCLLPESESTLESDIFSLTKASIVPLEEADYIIVAGVESGDVFEKAKKGTPAYPDKSATVIYLPGNESVVTEAITFSGPGINRARKVDNTLLPKKEWLKIKAVNSEYPLGVDVMVVSQENKVFCVPRSTQIKI